MSGIEIGLSSVAAIVLLIALGMHVAVALALTSFVGVWALKGSALLASRLLALAAFDGISSYVFGVIPLFILMGLVVSAAGIGRDTFEVANYVFRRVKGGLGVATVGANAVFAATTGISIASAAVFSKVAIPEMIRYGYRRQFAAGVVAGSSVLGMLIPPSLLFILYGIITEQSIGDLFIAGIGPGILLVIVYSAGIMLVANYLPSAIFTGGLGASDERASRTGESGGDDPPVIRAHGLGAGELFAKLGPIAALVLLILGGLYGGVFTPTEAGAVGALGAIVIAAAKKRLTPMVLWRVVVETGHITASICFLIIGAIMYTRVLSLTGLPEFIGSAVIDADIGLFWTIFAYVVIILIMGALLDSSSIMLVMVPLALPTISGYEIDLVWFGVMTVLAIEVGLLTPPFGLSVFAIKSALEGDGMSTADIFIGAFPFALAMLVVLALVAAFPVIALGLI